jgi:hypothetical protein
MTTVFSAIGRFVLLWQIHVAASLSQRSHKIPLPPAVSDNRPPHFQSVLILGSSIDRNSINHNYQGQTFTYDEEKLQHNVVNDKPRNVTIAVLQHPGVGLSGDLEGLFWNPGKKNESSVQGRRPHGTHPDKAGKNGAHWKFLPTKGVIKHAPVFSSICFGTRTPDLVVVESSLWDLASWWQLTGHQATPERLEQWCNKDLPFLLESVTNVFNESRVVFRTAPQVASWSDTIERWTLDNFEALHRCVERRSARTGEVFKNVGVIDYHEIMDELMKSKSDGDTRLQDEDLWLEDGYHPSALLGRHYLNEIFKLLNVPPMQAPESRHEKPPPVEDEDDL